MKRVALVGVGMTRFGKQPRRSLEDLGEEAVTAALADAGLPPSAVEGAWCGNVLGGGAAGQRVLGALGVARVPVANLESACASGSHALAEAWFAIASGRVGVALVLGVERVSGVLDGMITLDRQDRQTRLGLTLPGIYALNASRYMARHGATLRELAAVAVKNRRQGADNPLAMFQAAVTEEDVLGSPLVADPLTKLQCCANTDGAAAAVLVADDRLADLTGDPIWVRGVGVASGVPLEAGYELSVSDISRRAARAAYEAAGLGPADVDVAEVYDAFTIGEIIAVESLGLCAEGTAARRVADGECDREGSLPINPSGGLLARGHAIGASGLAQVAELAWQMRGTAGPRRGPRAQVALAHTVGGGVATHDGVASVVTILAA